MTRVNIVPVQELTDKHLIAEYREITRIPGNLNKSLNRKSKSFSFNEIPDAYTLGTGHVKFFYNKMLFLRKRYAKLIKEMNSRGFKTNYTDLTLFDVENKYMNDYTPTTDALNINRKRIKERLK